MSGIFDRIKKILNAQVADEVRKDAFSKDGVVLDVDADLQELHSLQVLSEEANGEDQGGVASSADDVQDRSDQPDQLDLTRPVTLERIGFFFDSQGWNWGIDDDGDFVTGFDSSQYVFRLTGKKNEIFTILAFRSTLVDSQLRSEVELLIEDWHATHLWPMASFVEKNGEIRILAERNLDCEWGLSDAQLVTQCKCGLSTISSFFEEVDERFGPAPSESDTDGDYSE